MKFIKRCSMLCIILLSGCAAFTNLGSPQFNVAVDSLAAPTSPLKKTYLLLPGNKEITSADLQFQEYATYLKRVLNMKGYVYTSLAEEADLSIFLSYGIGDPQTSQYSYNMPVWGRTGIYSSRTLVTKTSDDGKKTYKTITTHRPTYGLKGYSSYAGSITAYNRFAIIVAYDYERFKKEEKEIQLWKTTVTSTGSSDDLRRIFPILMAASIPYLATDTGHKSYVSLHETDDVVMKVKGVIVEQK